MVAGSGDIDIEDHLLRSMDRGRTISVYSGSHPNTVNVVIRLAAGSACQGEMM